VTTTTKVLIGVGVAYVAARLGVLGPDLQILATTGSLHPAVNPIDSLGAALKGAMPTSFFPGQNVGSIRVVGWLPDGTPVREIFTHFGDSTPDRWVPIS
jgi:hypothetical protein